MVSSALSAFAAISIHALREESDWERVEVRIFDYHFNPRSPRGERPEVKAKAKIWLKISIHALREESDALPSDFLTPNKSISIHALREESDITSNDLITCDSSISIHALREESDKA